MTISAQEIAQMRKDLLVGYYAHPDTGAGPFAYVDKRVLLELLDERRALRRALVVALPDVARASTGMASIVTEALALGEDEVAP